MNSVSLKITFSENLADRRKSNRHSSAAPFSPPISRTLRDLNNSIMNYVEPAQPQYNRRRSNRVQAFNDTSIRSDTQVRILIYSALICIIMIENNASHVLTRANVKIELAFFQKKIQGSIY